MIEPIPWRFLAFAAIFCAAVYLHFCPALWQWRKLRGEQDREIDVGYVRRDDYFGQSFRTKMEEWLKLPGSEVQDDGRLIWKGAERIHVVSGNFDLLANERCDDILVTGGDFSCGPESTLTRELLIRGDARIGAGSRLQSLAADGRVTLGAGTRVARWLDCSGEVDIGRECQVGARVTSRIRVRIALGSKLVSASAPEVVTEDWNGVLTATPPRPRDRLDIEFRKDLEAIKEMLEAARMKPDRIVQLSADTWLYKGDIEFPTPVWIRNKLVVKGNCSFPGESWLESDIKTTGSLALGPSCRIGGNLVADADMVIGERSYFSSNVYAGGTLIVRRGARGIAPGGLVAVYGGESLIAEQDVAVKGKLASGGQVVVVAEALSRFERGMS